MITFNDNYKEITDIPFINVNSYDNIPSNEKNLSIISTKEFHQSRNMLVSALSKFGNVGFQMETLLMEDEEGEFPYYRVQKNQEDFHLLDDDLYETERYHTLKIHEDQSLSIELLNSIWLSLWTFPDWALIIRTPTSYIYLEIDKIYLYVEKDLQPNFHGKTLEESIALISNSGITTGMILKKLNKDHSNRK